MNIKNIFVHYGQAEMDEKQKEIDKYKKLYEQLKKQEKSVIQAAKVNEEEKNGIEQFRKTMLNEIKAEREKLNEDLKKIQDLNNREVSLDQKEQEITALESSLKQFKLECMDRVHEADRSAQNCAHALKKLRFNYSELKRSLKV